MNKQVRMNQIISIVKQRNGESIKALSVQLGVTEMTIRRDVEQLKARQLVKVVSGAVVYNGETSETDGIDYYDLPMEKSKRTTEKYRIGKMAASLVEPGDVIYIDIGTTAPYIVQHIPSALSVVAVCCTMNTLIEIQKNGISGIILTGGTYRPDVQMFESKEGVELLGRTRINKAFMSAAGVNAQLGVTCVNSCEVDTKRAAMQCALEKILVVDSSKFDVVRSAFFARLEDFGTVITDSNLSAEWQEQIKAMGTRLHLV